MCDGVVGCVVVYRIVYGDNVCGVVDVGVNQVSGDGIGGCVTGIYVVYVDVCVMYSVDVGVCNIVMCVCVLYM